MKCKKCEVEMEEVSQCKSGGETQTQHRCESCGSSKTVSSKPVKKSKATNGESS